MMSDRDRKILIEQLYATRASIDASLMILEGDKDDSSCKHPKDSVSDLSTFGGEKYRCGLCGAESAKPFSTPAEE